MRFSKFKIKILGQRLVFVGVVAIRMNTQLLGLTLNPLRGLDKLHKSSYFALALGRFNDTQSTWHHSVNRRVILYTLP